MPESAILIVGNGTLGAAIAAVAGDRAIVAARKGASLNQIAFDVLKDDPAALIERLDCQPKAMVLAFGISGINACANDPAGTRLVNVDRTLALAAAAAGRGIMPVLLSTDYVFDGSKEFSSEEDEPKPICEYGGQKLAAEQALAAFQKPHLILRIGRVIADHIHRRDWLYRWCAQMQHGSAISLAPDQFLSPIAAEDAGRIIVSLIESDASGLLHVAGPNRISAVGLHGVLASACSELKVAVSAPVELSPLSDMSPRERRPRSTAMSVERLRKLLNPHFTSLDSCAMAVASSFFLGTPGAKLRN